MRLLVSQAGGVGADPVGEPVEDVGVRDFDAGDGDDTAQVGDGERPDVAPAGGLADDERVPLRVGRVQAWLEVRGVEVDVAHGGLLRRRRS
ncbi:hypothetical protein ACFFX1_55570 [Dactylosporangium sucinum]|uniref:Uncharacterized protein n=1 Tax=Dactylosporangium sucinum TaxID=1424081 RepID=A0A917X1D1_9ACTN|nr:hypothetical protein [Dactylosporangium sucinum]GGM52436.1 hypothetical protein GCM10007977_062500 [Dactylosporangium sucinum]